MFLVCTIKDEDRQQRRVLRRPKTSAPQACRDVKWCKIEGREQRQRNIMKQGWEGDKEKAVFQMPPHTLQHVLSNKHFAIWILQWASTPSLKKRLIVLKLRFHTGSLCWFYDLTQREGGVCRRYEEKRDKDVGLMRQKG